MVFLAYFAAFAMALCYGISAVVEDRAAKRRPVTGRGGKRAAFRVTVSVGYLAGMAVSVVAWVFSLIALHRLPLFAVQAIAASSIGVVVLITSVITHRKPSRREGILLAALAFALIVLAVSAAPTAPKTVSWVFTLFIGSECWRWRRRGEGDSSHRRAVVPCSAVAGLSDGGMALCARALHHDNLLGLVTDPLALALIPFTVIGIVAFAASLQRGAVAVTVACQQAVVTVVPAVIGLLVLGDTARHGFGVVTYVGFVVAVFVVVALTFTTAVVTPPLVAPAALPPARSARSPEPRHARPGHRAAASCAGQRDAARTSMRATAMRQSSVCVPVRRRPFAVLPGTVPAATGPFHRRAWWHSEPSPRRGRGTEIARRIGERVVVQGDRAVAGEARP